METRNDPVLKRLRAICLGLPEAVECVTFGHPTFRAGKKTFAVYEEYKGQLCIAFKVDPRHKDIFLSDPRFFRTPYVGKHGWVSLKFSGRMNWTEVRHLMIESYRLVASRRMLSCLDCKD